MKQMARTKTTGSQGKPQAKGTLVYPELSHAVVGCARRVHAALGPGFPESVYRRALCMELAKQGIPFVSEASFEVLYENAVCGQFRVDLLVHDKIVLELKAVSDVCEDHVSQIHAYLKATGVKLGILMNFGKKRLQTKRIVMSKR